MHSRSLLASSLLLSAASGLVERQGRDSGLSQMYCSNQNTADSSTLGTWSWQSNGHCFDQCKSNYAFAVVQGENCWCSDYVPYSQMRVDRCNRKCPGYPEESCGDQEDGLFGYIKLSKEAAGTAGMPSPSEVQTVTQSASVIVSFVTATPSPTPQPSTTTYSSSSSSSSSSSQEPPVQEQPPTPVTSFRIVTISGAPVTETVTFTPTAFPDNHIQQTQKSTVSGGTIAGAVCGALAGLAIIVALALWFLRRRKRGDDESLAGSEKPSGGSPKRNVSTLSKAGLLRTSEREYPIAAPAPSTNRSSMRFEQDNSSPTSERRNSRPLFYDQRLNPSALMDLDNGSHTSIITMADNRDYTRTLNVRNPDPPGR